MPTITVTSADIALMQCTDVMAAHLLIVAHGRPTNRAFTVPPGKTIKQYADDQALLNGMLGPVGRVLQGKLRPCTTAPAGHRIPDYTLSPVRGYTSPGLASHPYAALLRYVEQAGREAGAQTPRDGLSLGPGVPCDILCLRPRRVSSWLTSRFPRLSQLVAEGLLTRYAHLHCLLSPVERTGSPTGTSKF